MSTPFDDDFLQEGLAQGLLGGGSRIPATGLGGSLIQGAQQTPVSSATDAGGSGNYATVYYYKGEDGNRAGHAGISVNGGPAYGLNPAFDSLGLSPLPNPGIVEPVAANRKVLDQIRLPITTAQAKQIQQYSLNNAGPTTYDVLYRNCATFVNDALRSAGMNPAEYPLALAPKGLLAGLHQIYDASKPAQLISTRPTLPKY